MMNKDILIYIQQNNGAELAVIQQKFGISYKEAKTIVDEMVSKGTLVYESGVKYSYVKKGETPDDRRAELERRRIEAIREMQSVGDLQDNTDDEEKRRAEERRAYLEARRQELIRRMQAEMDEDDDEEDEDEEYEDELEMDEDELRYKALKLCVERDTVSVSLLQRSLPIGYIKSCKLIDWMESKGYISTAVGSKPRKVLITEEKFEKLFGDPNNIDDNEDDYDIDAKFAKYEKYLKQYLSDETENDEAETKDIINRSFHSDEVETGVSDDDPSERKASVQNLVVILNKISDKKKAPVSASVMPDHPSWEDEDEFVNAVMERLEWLIRSDKRMGQQGAVKKAETYLEAVKDTHDRKMVQVYERLVDEIKNTSSYLYKQLKKQYFGE